MNKQLKIGKVNVELSGRFRLDVNADPRKFVVTNINSFVPYGKTAEGRVRFTTISGEVDSLIITRVSTTFKPDENDVDDKNVQALIQHPDVMLKGLSAEEWKELVKLNLKKPNPKFVLTNVDKVETVSYDNEVELIQVRAVLHSVKEPLTKEKLIWLCSNFGIPYRSQITDEKRYRMQLIKSLDTFIQKGKENRDLFLEKVENIKNTEIKFYINELINIGSITDIGGIYKIGDKPVGSSKEHLINYYKQNEDLFMQHKKLVLDSLQGIL